MRRLEAALRKLGRANKDLRPLIVSVLATEDTEEDPHGRKGPPPKWDEFLKAKYNSGKRKVPNPHPDSAVRKKTPRVTILTAMGTSDTLKQKVMREYGKWIEAENKKEDKEKKEDEESGYTEEVEDADGPYEGEEGGGEESLHNRLQKLRL